MDAAAATGAAHDATVVAVNDIPALEAALAAARQAQEDAIPVRDLANAEAKVEKYRRFLAEAEAEVIRLRAVTEGTI